MTLHPSRAELGHSHPQQLKTPQRAAQMPPAPDKPVRVTLIADDELTSRGLSSMLREHSEQIELVRLTQSLTAPIDIALYDNAVTGPGSGPTLAQLLSDPRIRKVALFAWNFRPWTAADLVSQGAAAYLSKCLTTAELITALHAVHTNKGPTAQTANSRASMAYQAELGELLTHREAQTLTLISCGLSNTEIAATLNLSANTVKSYIRTCYRKIDVESRSQAVLWGLGHGFGGNPDAAHTQAVATPAAARLLATGGSAPVSTQSGRATHPVARLNPR